MTVLSPPFARPSDLLRYPAGSAAHAVVQLLLAIEYDDPTAAKLFFGPAWKLTTPKLALEIRGPLNGTGALVGRDPRLTAEVLHGRHATLVVTTGASAHVVLGLQNVGSHWELDSVRAGQLTLPRPHSARRRVRRR